MKRLTFRSVKNMAKFNPTTRKNCLVRMIFIINKNFGKKGNFANTFNEITVIKKMSWMSILGLVEKNFTIIIPEKIIEKIKHLMKSIVCRANSSPNYKRRKENNFFYKNVRVFTGKINLYASKELR